MLNAFSLNMQLILILMIGRPGMRVHCSCGAQVLAINLVKHRSGQSHTRRVRRQELLENRGGVRGLQLCSCGLVISTWQKASHKIGKEHGGLSFRRKHGYPICESCGLAYIPPYRCHEQSWVHVKNIMRLRNLHDQIEQIHEAEQVRNEREENSQILAEILSRDHHLLEARNHFEDELSPEQGHPQRPKIE